LGFNEDLKDTKVEAENFFESSKYMIFILIWKVGSISDVDILESKRIP
jgi:hypothetical protein